VGPKNLMRCLINTGQSSPNAVTVNKIKEHVILKLFIP
jgi:hypothetical protein